jgi:FkbM family methyltransferase
LPEIRLAIGFRGTPILKRLYPSLRKSWARLTWIGGYKVKRYGDLLLLLNWRNYVDRQIGLLGGYEREQIDYLLSRMAGGCDGFIDVGANFGLYSLIVARSGRARAIHAFEPDPRNLGQLAGNLYLNKLTGVVQVHPLAVSDRVGPLAFTLADDGATGKTYAAADGGTTLMATTLDDALQLSGATLFLKIDIEGHALAALRGAERLLRDNRCFLQIETWAHDFDAVSGLLRAFGYRAIHRIHDDHYFEKPVF